MLVREALQKHRNSNPQGDWCCRFFFPTHSFLQPKVKYIPNVYACLKLLIWGEEDLPSYGCNNLSPYNQSQFSLSPRWLRRHWMNSPYFMIFQDLIVFLSVQIIIIKKLFFLLLQKELLVNYPWTMDHHLRQYTEWWRLLRGNDVTNEAASQLEGWLCTELRLGAWIWVNWGVSWSSGKGLQSADRSEAPLAAFCSRC